MVGECWREGRDGDVRFRRADGGIVGVGRGACVFFCSLLGGGSLGYIVYAYIIECKITFCTPTF